MPKDSLLSGAITRFPALLKERLRGCKTTKLAVSEAPFGGVTAASSASSKPNMGKSNKFDYTNRPNSGAKLGHIIGSALQKEAEKVNKEAEKHSQKHDQRARKQSISSTAEKPHLIDLKAPNKDLGDDGVTALADGLEAALEHGNTHGCLALEDLNLSKNGMTMTSVVRLAPIVERSKYDLKTLNLSNNDIRVETDEQAEQWEVFLNSFRECQKLRRLDLSGNQHLGRRAIEIFARVHTGEPPIHPIAPGGDQSVFSLSSRDEEDSYRSQDQLNEDDGDDGSGSESLAVARFMKRRCGLRSIPYITLHDIGLDEAGALWLSYIMADHYYPDQLMDELNGTHAESVIKTYQQDTNSRGIDWSDNMAVSKEAKYLLEKTDILRRQTMNEDVATLNSVADIDDVPSSPRQSQEAVRRSTDRKHSRAAGDRRASIRSIRTDDGGEHEATEVESMQRKIQRHIIANEGVQSVELWRAALKVLKLSRMILYITPLSARKHFNGEPTSRIPSLTGPETVRVHAPSPADSPVTRSPSRTSFDASKPGKSSMHLRPSYTATLSGTSRGSEDVPESPLTEVTNTPVTPLLIQKRTHRQGAFSEGADLQTVSEKLNHLLVEDDDPNRFMIYQMKRIAEAKEVFRNTAMPCHLPIHLLQRIISLTPECREMGVLSARQKQVAIERGQSRKTLTAEREWLKRDESAQLWMLLDSLKCLAYSME